MLALLTVIERQSFVVDLCNQVGLRSHPLTTSRFFSFLMPKRIEPRHLFHVASKKKRFRDREVLKKGLVNFRFQHFFNCCQIQEVNFNEEIKHGLYRTSRDRFLQDAARKKFGDAFMQSIEGYKSRSLVGIETIYGNTR